MKLINPENSDDNWRDVLALWSLVVNWAHHKPSESELRRNIKQLINLLWNEKDWLKNQYPEKNKEIELFINNSQYMKVIADLANTTKHRSLTREKRSGAEQTDFYGRTTINNDASRRLYYISMGNGQHVEIISILRGAINEIDGLRFKYLSEKHNSL